MRLQSLSLRGAVGIERGLGLDEITLDFTGFESGLIAFVAPNGHGKSTILENLQPYRKLVTRDGALHRHFGLKDSKRDLRWEMGGHEYRSLILIDGVRGGQEAYLYRDGEPMNDGKTASYDAAVRGLVGSEELFFQSLFQSQTRESITSLTAGRRKDLFVALLGLSHLAEYHETAKAHANGLEAEIERVRAAAAVYREQAAGLPALESRAVTERERIDDLEHAQVLADAEIEALRSRLFEAQQSLALAEARRPELQAAEADLDNAVHDLHACNATHKDAARALDIQLRDLGTDEETAQRTIEARRSEYARKTARAEKLVTNRGTIKSRLAAIDALRTQIQGYEAQRIHLSDLKTALRRAEDTERQAEMLLRDHERHVESAESRLAQLRKTAGLAREVPCADTDLQPRCPLLRDAVTAEGEAAELEGKLSQLRATAPPEPDRSESERLILAIKSLPYDPAAHNEALESLREHEETNWHALDSEAQAAEAVVSEIREALEAHEQRHRATLDYIAKRRGEINSEVERERAASELQRTAAAERIDALNIRCAALRRELEGAARICMAIEVMQREMSDKASHRSNREEVLAAARTAYTRTEAAIEAARTAISALEKSEASIAPTVTEHAEWSLLARACGKDGIQALELDAAGPGVSAIANQLLADTFGSEFQIAFETTRPSLDGKKQIETFEVRVYSGGQEQTIENLSGGQRVWVEAAISQAIAIYLRRKSGLDLHTSFLDEADGALDSENAFRYLSMLRASHALAGVHHTLLITHRQELLSHIPQQIRLVPGEGAVCQQ
jgi:DNA repair protein SbcC/Rad50